MSIGFPQDKNALDARLGGLAVQMRNLFNDDVPNLQLFLSGQTLATLEALGYSATEAQLIKTNWGVIAQFASAFQGGQAIPSAVDVRPFLTPFEGVN